MNIDDKVPEHILEEIFGHNKNKDKITNVVHEFETLTSIEDFNDEVSKKLGRQKQSETEEDLFDTIIGYSDIKKILMKCIMSSETEPMHVILDGAPASAKTMFLLAMQKKLRAEGVYFVDCSSATGPGLVDYLFENDVKFLLLDEVEKMPKSNQNVLLNVMETGMLTSTKVRKTRSKKMNLSIYATTNEIDALSKPFRSRFMEFSLPEYTYRDFCDIAVKLLSARYGHGEELSLKIADTVWNKNNSRDVRDMLQVAQLTKTIDDLDFVACTLQKYKRKKEY
jgi:Holliday junction resolvasome RuvABC ATP-dependent DNA helicase subunit